MKSTIEDQTKDIFQQLDKLLGDHNLTVNDIQHITLLLSDMSNFAKVNKFYGTFSKIYTYHHPEFVLRQRLSRFSYPVLFSNTFNRKPVFIFAQDLIGVHKTLVHTRKALSIHSHLIRLQHYRGKYL